MGKRKRRYSEDIRRKIKRLKQSLNRRCSYSDEEASDRDFSTAEFSDYEENSRASASSYSDTEGVKSMVTWIEKPAAILELPSTSQAGPNAGVPLQEATVIDLPANVLDGSKEKEDIFGPKIAEEISKRWGRILVEGLGKEQKEELTEKFLIPENFKLLKAPKLNQEIAAVMTESSLHRDQRMEKAQNHLGLAIAGLSRLTTFLISGEMEKLDIIKQIADISQLLSDLHSENTDSRRKIILPSLDKKFINMIQEVKRYFYLFGENLGEIIRASKTAEKSGLQIKRSYTTTPSGPTKYTSRQGNWKGSPRHQGPWMNKSGGHRNRAPQQYPRPTTSEKYQTSSSRKDSRPSRKHH